MRDPGGGIELLVLRRYSPLFHGGGRNGVEGEFSDPVPSSQSLISVLSPVTDIVDYFLRFPL